ncbi:Olfactory receptor 5A1 [Chelonia mydas]|uniref:Olfactory receptor 5A1 n=1 Tax=Chelonia mydas TaxID=8469 RepID=M7ASM4_CHEMY|nr:Olfactory receptor 5A1 [Chelonia mydas]
MPPGNCTVVTEFIFLAFPTHPDLQTLFFMSISLVFTATVTGNLLILVAIRGDACLHTPMYFFLEGLSIVELGYAAAIFPQMLVNALQERKRISFGGCGAQVFFFLGLGSSDCFLLVAMAYDRSRSDHKDRVAVVQWGQSRKEPGALSQAVTSLEMARCTGA